MSLFSRTKSPGLRMKGLGTEVLRRYKKNSHCESGSKISNYLSQDEKCGEEKKALSIVQRAPGRSEVERRFEVTRLEMGWGFPPEIPPSAEETSLC